MCVHVCVCVPVCVCVSVCEYVSGIDVKQSPHRNTHSLSLIVFVSDDFCFHSCALDPVPPPPPPLIPPQSLSVSLSLSDVCSLSVIQLDALL